MAMFSKQKPRIGVTGPDKGEKILRWFTFLGIRVAGGTPVRITATDNKDLSSFDGFILTGGRDINPQNYGEAAALQDLQYDQDRDSFELEVVRYAVENQKPLLGICRGMQMLNIALGGSLYQEAKEALEGFIPSENLLSKIIGRRIVYINKQSKLYSILGEQERLRVNSIHHQAVNQVGRKLQVVAREENKLIQAVEPDSTCDHPFLMGVQWHPELMLYTRHSRRLFEELIRVSGGVSF